ncbi:hypothetical protein [Phaffia rhodozyma]|uniref:Uncharacterized protein n=1 Tax=Phaffia rhodozyma TaxID=264483 RepID=A0A0F7SGZ8_PHARH|nr:hypothetical protein [Phaffia rhodozyma]
MSVSASNKFSTSRQYNAFQSSLKMQTSQYLFPVSITLILIREKNSRIHIKHIEPLVGHDRVFSLFCSIFSRTQSVLYWSVEHKEPNEPKQVPSQLKVP